MKQFGATLLLALTLIVPTSLAQAAIKCTAVLTYANTGNQNQVVVILASGEELMEIGYEKSSTTGSRVRRSEVYAIIDFANAGHLILEIPNIRAERALSGDYIANEKTFKEIETRNKIHTKSFNSEYDYTLDLGEIVSD